MDKRELTMLQALPLDVKIAKSKLRIEEFIRTLGGSDKVYISFSGGKDSTVLLDLVRSIYPDVEGIFSNTGLEFPELVNFVKTKENITMVRPKKSFKQVIEQDGYPVVSKKTSRMLKDLKNPTDKNIRIRSLYLSEYALDKDGNPTEIKNNSFRLAEKWKYLIDAPFKISNRCCDILKKNPIKDYEKISGKKPIIGTMAIESKMRESAYLQSGCNSFAEGKERCNPLGFWTEQDILEYIVRFNLPYASVYGDIVKDNEGRWITSGEKRTGCIFCMYGIHLEKGENRFQRLQKTHPQLHSYCMDKLGFRTVCEYMNIPCEDTQYNMFNEIDKELK